MGICGAKYTKERPAEEHEIAMAVGWRHKAEAEHGKFDQYEILSVKTHTLEAPIMSFPVEGEEESGTFYYFKVNIHREGQ
jgi:hypothetical protein